MITSGRAITPCWERLAYPLGCGTDPLDNGASGSFEDLGILSMDDLLSTYMDIEKFRCKLENGSAPPLPKRKHDNAAGASGS
ncbi:hypothetical protein SAY87_027589 [Trapa incisa]|uniref:Uncharacterized protein n=2 Tax=Trapa TaxID=22665 RepID=A0AAN7M482_TRANT|nr:hypothetical protein SAY87_027589 [Trapa incisa]KAK4798975.1 hypothetical protein SAY86_024340 [Trapa natans]